MNVLILFHCLLAGLVLSAFGQARTCPPLNICFAIDESGSIDSSEFQTLTNAIVAIARELETRAPGSSYSAAGWSSGTRVSTIQTLTTDLETQFIPAVEANTRSGGNTASGLGLRQCKTLLDGASEPRVTALLTDGGDNSSPRGVDEAPVLKADGIAIAAIGIGGGVNSADLMQIASGPEFFTPVTDFDALVNGIAGIVDDLCTVVTPPTPTASPSSSESAAPSPSTSGSASPSVSPSTSPTPSQSPAASPSMSPAASPSPSMSTSQTPSPSPSMSPSASPSKAAPTLPKCVKVRCVTCGRNLECYVNTGSPYTDGAICSKVQNRKMFCPHGWGKETVCGQRCGRMMPRCYAGEDPPAKCTRKGLMKGYGMCKGTVGGGKWVDRSVRRRPDSRRRNRRPTNVGLYKVCRRKIKCVRNCNTKPRKW